MSTEPTHNSILQEAHGLIFGARSEAYGHPLDNFELIAELWDLWLYANHSAAKAITAEDVAIMMTLVKIARQRNKPQRDNILDAAGYLGCYERVEDERKRRASDARATERLIEDAFKQADVDDLRGTNTPREDTPTIRRVGERVNDPSTEAGHRTLEDHHQPYANYKGPHTCASCERTRP